MCLKRIKIMGHIFVLIRILYILFNADINIINDFLIWLITKNNFSFYKKICLLHVNMYSIMLVNSLVL